MTESKGKPLLTRGDAQRIIDVINGALGSAIRSLIDPSEPKPDTRAAVKIERAVLDADQARKIGTISPGESVDVEQLYQKIKARLLQDLRVDPILLHMVANSAPELRVDIEPRLVEIDASSLRGRVARLMYAGFFGESRATFAVRKELARIGSDPGGGGNLSSVLSGFKNEGFLVDDNGGYRLAPGVKVTENVLEVV